MSTEAEAEVEAVGMLMNEGPRAIPLWISESPLTVEGKVKRNWDTEK